MISLNIFTATSVGTRNVISTKRIEDVGILQYTGQHPTEKNYPAINVSKMKVESPDVGCGFSHTFFLNIVIPVKSEADNSCDRRVTPI